MAITTLVLSSRETAVGPLVFDAAPGESTTQRATVTNLPVQAGGTRADNRRIEPSTYEIDGLIGDLSPIPGANLLPSSRADDAYELLSELLETGELVQVRANNPLPSRLRRARWTVAQLVRQETLETGRGLRVRVTLQEYLEDDVEDVPNPIADLADDAVAGEDLGRSSTLEVVL